MSREPADRDEVRRLAREQAWSEGQDCPTCGGAGRIPGGRKLIHTMAGSFGADHTLEDVLADIDRADIIEWRDTTRELTIGHHLSITIDGHAMNYEIARPRVITS
jgi:hypothetical protein